LTPLEILDLVVTNARELTGDFMIGGSQGCSDHTLVDFTVLRDTGKGRSIVRTLNFRKANFQLLEELFSRNPGKWSSGAGGRTELADP